MDTYLSVYNCRLHHKRYTRKTVFPIFSRPLLPQCNLDSFISSHKYLFHTGGWHASTENTNKVERFDPNGNKWEPKAPLNERRYRPGVAVVDGKIYVMGGEEGWDR